VFKEGMKSNGATIAIADSFPVLEAFSAHFYSSDVLLPE
jgi:hypothetical protein